MSGCAYVKSRGEGRIVHTRRGKKAQAGHFPAWQKRERYSELYSEPAQPTGRERYSSRFFSANLEHTRRQPLSDGRRWGQRNGPPPEGEGSSLLRGRGSHPVRRRAASDASRRAKLGHVIPATRAHFAPKQTHGRGGSSAGYVTLRIAGPPSEGQMNPRIGGGAPTAGRKGAEKLGHSGAVKVASRPESIR